MYIRLAWRNLWRNKRRTGITIAAISFAVMFAIAMRSMQLGSYDNMVNNAVKFYSGYAQVHKQGYWEEQSLENTFEYSDSLTNEALKLPAIHALIPRIESYVLASSGLKTRGINVTGIHPVMEKQLTELDQKIISGSYLDSSDSGILLTEGLAGYLDTRTGDTTVLVGMGYHGANAAGKYAVKGIIRFNNPELNKRYAFLTLENARWLFAAPERLTALVVVTDPDHVGKAVRSLHALFGSEYEVMDWREMMPELVQAIEADSIGGIIILCILYIVIGFGIFGTIVMMTAERNHEFGILIALGMKRGRLLSIITVESIMMSMIGVVIGMSISFPMVLYFYFNPIPLSDELKQVSEAYGIEAIIPFSIAPAIFIYQALAVLVISLLAMSYPLVRVGILKPSEAMRG